MARLNHGQRLDLLEQEVAGLSARVAQEITTALAAFKTDLNHLLAAGQEKIRSDLYSSLINGSPSTGITHFHLNLSWEMEKEATQEAIRIGSYENLTYLCLTVQIRTAGFSELSGFSIFTGWGKRINWRPPLLHRKEMRDCGINGNVDAMQCLRGRR